MKCLDVIIPTKNSGDTIRDCLLALKSQTREANIIIVDAQSIDETKSIAIKHGATIIPEPPSTTKGSRRALACNEGLRHSLSTFVGFIDSDTILPDTWVEDLIPYLLNSPKVGAVTSGCISSKSDSLSIAISTVIKLGSTHARNFVEVTKIDSCPGYNSIYRREAIDLVGGFSEDIGGCEDWELNHRIREAGWEILGVPQSPVEHRERNSLGSFSKQMYGYAWSRGRLLRVKNHFTPIHMMPSLALIFLFLLPLINLSIAILVTSMGALAFFSLLLIIPFSRIPLYTLITFTVMQISWAIGYFAGLIA